MTDQDQTPGGWNRREFSRLALAALGGMVAGCQSENPPPATPPAGGKTPATEQKKETPRPGETSAKAPPGELHLCRGLNSCKDLGGGATAGKNGCAGQGACATVAEHGCGGQNDCKGFGGCGTSAGQNACKGKGGCHVPLMEDAWKSVRLLFEKKMKTEGKKFGEAPAPMKG